MKFRITMRDPDKPYEDIDTAAKESLGSTPLLTDHERELLLEARWEALSDFTRTWLEYGEYVELEFDTDANTCTVVPVKEHSE